VITSLRVVRSGPPSRRFIRSAKDAYRVLCPLARGLDAVKKDKIAAQRERANMRAARDKLANELSFLRPELEALKTQAAAAKTEKEKAMAERAMRLNKAHDDLDALADAVLKELQSEKAKLELRVVKRDEQLCIDGANTFNNLLLISRCFTKQ